MLNKRLPSVTFKTRVRDENISETNPYRWQDVKTEDYFSGKRAILFSLPGAFTPICSTYQLPNYENLHSKFSEKGIDEIFCVSVNDAFVMNAWKKDQNIEKIVLIPDGAGEFTRKMGMLVYKDNLGFGMRSWRYAAVINDGIVELWYEEPGFCDNSDDDPYGVSSPEKVLEQL